MMGHRHVEQAALFDEFLARKARKSLLQMTFFGSFVSGTQGLPFSEVPLQEIATVAAACRLDVKPVRTFRFGEICKGDKVNGKMVVLHA